jgi:hypothetical protein
VTVCDVVLFQRFDSKRRSTWFSEEIPQDDTDEASEQVLA